MWVPRRHRVLKFDFNIGGRPSQFRENRLAPIAPSNCRLVLTAPSCLASSPSRSPGPSPGRTTFASPSGALAWGARRSKRTGTPPFCADDADRSTCLADGLCVWDGTKHDGACADAADPGADEFTFERGGKTRTCAWVAKRPKKNKRKICEENAGRATRRVGLACPAACAVEAEPSAMVTCEDSPTFTYKKWTCAKIAKAKDKKKTKICSKKSNGVVARDACPAACGVCKPPCAFEDSTMWWTGKSKKKKTCATIGGEKKEKKKAKLCKKKGKGDDTSKGKDSCPAACGLCEPPTTPSPTTSPTPAPSAAPTPTPPTLTGSVRRPRRLQRA